LYQLIIDKQGNTFDSARGLPITQTMYYRKRSVMGIQFHRLKEELVSTPEVILLSPCLICVSLNRSCPCQTWL